MSTALPKIDQIGKPAGVPGQSRDDLDLYTVPGTEIVLSDGGTGATTWAWSILDQPPGASATLTTPLASVTNLTGVTVRGSYLLQLVVDGGALPSQVYRVIAGVQLAMPSWVTPALNRPLRIPAKGETTEFNVESSPGAGANSRGWAQEMDHWFRALASFSFGTPIQDAGTPFGSEPFYTLNLVGFGLTDLGSGVLQVDSLGISGIEARNASGAVVPGGPWAQLNFRAPTAVNSAYFQSDLNAVVQPGTAELEVVVTAAQHQSTQHTGGILLNASTTVNRNALKCSVNTGPNPMTLSFSALSTSGPDTKVVADGAVIDVASFAGAHTYSEPAPTSKSLRMLCVGMTSGGPVIESVTLAEIAIPVASVVVVDFSTEQDTVAMISLSAGLLSLNSGPVTSYVAGQIVRLYDYSGAYWIDVFCNGVAVDGTETWSIYGSAKKLHKCALAVAPYWVNGTVATWGVNVDSAQQVIDVRQFGSIGKEDLQDTVLREIERISSDLQWQAGVIFQNESKQFSVYGSEDHLDSFGLVPKTSGSPLQEASAVKGGSCWGGGRRYVVSARKSIASLALPANDAICIYVSLKAGVASIDGFSVSSGNPIDAVDQCLQANSKAPFQPPALAEIRVPLYFGRLNATADALIADGRIDLRRDVAHHGQWTVAERDPSTASLALIGETFRSRPAQMIATRWAVAGRAVAEFNSISAALAWHGALTSSDNLTPLAPLDGSSQNYVTTTLRVIGDTRENFPIHLRNNITIEGEGTPFIFVSPSKWWSSFGLPTYGWTYFNIGDEFSTNKFVYSVTLKNLTLALISYDRTVQGAGGNTVAALSVWAGDYNAATTNPPAGWTLAGTTQQVLIDHVGFDVISTNVQVADTVSAIRLQDTTGPVSGGTFGGVTLRDCYTLNMAEPTSGVKSAFNYGLFLHLTNPVWHDKIEVSKCVFAVNTHGLRSDTSALIQNSQFTQNTFLVQMNVLDGGQTTAYGIRCDNGNLVDSHVDGNKFRLSGAAQISRSISLGCGLSNTTVDANVEDANNGTTAASAGIYVAPSTWSVNRSSLCDNRVSCLMNGILVQLAAATGTESLSVSRNQVRSGTGGFSGSSGKGISVRHLSTSGTSEIQVSENTINDFVFGLDFQFESIKGLQITNNSIRSSSTYAESTGIMLDFRSTTEAVSVLGNTVREAKNGIEVSLSDLTGDVSINANTIFGLFEAPAGSSNGRGIYLYANPRFDTILGVSVKNNCIRNMLSPSATDTVPGGGIVIENQSAVSFISDIKINENDIMAHAGETSGFPISMSVADYTNPIVGIAVIGLVRGVQIDGNKITNRAVIFNSLLPHGGIVFQNTHVLGSTQSFDTQVTSNHVTWCDASFVDGVDTRAAGIFVDCASAAGYQVNGNSISVQSIMDADGVIPGSVHGILVGESYGTPENMQVCNNKILAGKFDVGSNLPGICGSAIWVFGAIRGLQLHSNDCTGYFRKAVSGDNRHYWGVISVAVIGDESRSVQNVLIDGNSIVAGDGTGVAVGSRNLAFGLHVGSINRTSDNASRVLINSNRITAVLDGTDSTNGAALSVQAVITSTGASGGSSLQVSSNYVERVGLSGVSVHGLAVQGWRETQVNDSVIPYFVNGFEIYEPAHTGAVSSNIWANNRAGTAANNGAISLVTPPYQPPPGNAKNNWNGNSFF